MKKLWMVVGVVLLIALAGGGGFYAGMQYQSNQVEQAQANFLQARGQVDGQVPGFMPGAGQFPGGMQGELPGETPTDRQGGMMGGGVSGEVKSLQDNTLTLSTAEDVTTVTLSAETTVLMTVEGETSDLQPGQRVWMTGERDSEGNWQATRVQVLDGDPLVRTAP